MKIKPSQFASSILVLKGKPLSFEMYKPFEAIYDGAEMPALHIQAGRQLGKSVALAGSLITQSIARPHFNSLFISPLAAQSARFSVNYLDPYLNGPLVKKHFIDRESKKNVFLKTLNTQSKIYLGYAETENDADRLRGINADQILVDEGQDVAYEALPVIIESMSSSPHAFLKVSGTAKQLGNTLDRCFKRGKQLEWCMKCPGCSKWIVPYDFDTCFKIVKNGKEGPACPFCAKSIDLPNAGSWVAMNPTAHDFSFHLPQIIFGARCVPKKWNEIRNKCVSPDAYSPGKMANEIFGVAAGSGDRILSIQECMACCDESKAEFDKSWSLDPRGIINVVVGVDWSVTGGEKSFTCISVLGQTMDGKLYLMHAERLNGIDILDQVRRVMEIYRQFNAQLIASDRGVGILQCEIMSKELGEDRVVPINYCAAKVGLRWDPHGRFFAADRTMMIDSVVLKMKIGREKFCTPAWSKTAIFWADALAVFEEETMSGRRVYRKDESKPDDWLHSVVFANVGMQIVTGNYKYTDELPPAAEAFGYDH